MCRSRRPAPLPRGLALLPLAAAAAALLPSAAGLGGGGEAAAAAAACEAGGEGGAGSECVLGRALLQVQCQMVHNCFSALQYGGGRLSAACASGSTCEVPAGEVLVVDRNISVESLTVKGKLVWDRAAEGVVLETGYLLVTEGGELEIGTAAQPMEKRATIYIKRSSSAAASGWVYNTMGARFLGSYTATGASKKSTIRIHGRRLARTWTLLARTAGAGATGLVLKHDPDAMGWRVGDRIGLATTSRGVSTVHTIKAIQPAADWALRPARAVADPGLTAATWGEVAEKAIDGTTNWPPFGTYCGGGSSCTRDSHWLIVQLEKPSMVTRMRINFDERRFPPAYEVQVTESYSGDSTVWASAASVTEGGGGGWREVAVGRHASALRVVADYDSMERAFHEGRREPGFAGLWIYELEAYGQEDGSEAPIVTEVDPPLTSEHWGGLREVQGHLFEMAAEVVNLERSVLITGDHDTGFYDPPFEGLHTIMSGPGLMDVRYTRVEFCGQRDKMGRYCLHFHHGGHCPDCTFLGNAVVDSQQIGITAHATHDANVEENVVWDARGVGLYTEDGNEMNNTLQRNVAICSWYKVCSVNWLGKIGQFAGIYMIGMSNHVLENRVAGYENAIWTVGGVFPHGQGQAVNKVCPQFTSFGMFRGNVNHDCPRFGLYLDNQYPRNIKQDDDGKITDPASCQEFTADGHDNGALSANLIEDSFEWHNIFVGGYAMGDLSFVRLVSVNNAHSFYWKTSKNFADGRSYHFQDCIFANDPLDAFGNLQVLGPAGPFTFRVRNVSFLGAPVGTAALAAGQHCGRGGAGGPCTVQYLLEGVSFSGIQHEGARWIEFGTPGSTDLGRVQPIFLAADDSLGGYRTMVSPHLNGFAKIPGCARADAKWDDAHACGAGVPIRRFNIWSQDLGTLSLSGPGYEVEPRLEAPVHGMNAGRLLYEAMHGGYGLPVIAGREYRVTGAWEDGAVMEFSDALLDGFFGAAEQLSVVWQGSPWGPCRLAAASERPFVGPRGVGPAAGAAFTCSVPPTTPPPAGAAPQTETTPANCHTVQPGEACYQHVAWAKDTGINLFPQWYPSSLSKTSSFEDFQSHLHTLDDFKDICPVPCA